MTDDVAAALRECEEACPCAQEIQSCGRGYCKCVPVLEREDVGREECDWSGHTAIRRYGDLREKAAMGAPDMSKPCLCIHASPDPCPRHETQEKLLAAARLAGRLEQAEVDAELAVGRTDPTTASRDYRDGYQDGVNDYELEILKERDRLRRDVKE